MPLNVRRLYTSVLLILVGFVLVSVAQTVLPASSPTPQTSTDPQTVQPPVKVPTAGEIMRDRISKAKAFIAVRNYNAAIYELENIRRETADASVQAVVNVLLMNSYLEQGDYKKAQSFLNDLYNQQKTTKANATGNYLAIASQVVKSARNSVERYRALGLNVGDRTLPLEAVNDLEKMRETLELVITQSKEVGKDKAKTSNAMALLEEAANSRSLMARDEYDARRWKDVVGDTREQMAVSRSVVVNAVNDGVPDAAVQQNTAPTQNQIAANSQTAAVPTGSMPTEPKPMFLPVMPDNKTTKPADNLNASVQKPIIVQNPKTDDRTAASNNPANAEPKALVISNPQTKPNDTNTAAPAAKEQGPMDVGSLLAYATRQAPPLYPPAAKSIRATGIVRVEVTVDENGDVAAVQKTSGPPLLQGAAKDAIKKWRFKPFVRDGQPVKATGFVNFNFSL